jgi:cyclohexadieny/prephenate dehydrogenase
VADTGKSTAAGSDLGLRREIPLFRRIAIIGFGLIGSSVARAVRSLNLAGEIVAIDSSAAVRGRAVALELADVVTDNVTTGVVGADHVLLCVPVGACGDVAAAMASGLAEGTIVSDVGSVKNAVVRDVSPHLPEGVFFVPAHPVAGTEHSGPDAGFASLFVNRWCILTPPEGTPDDAVMRVQALWEGMGSIVEVMTPAHHDIVLAITSHVPHLIAYNIVGTAADLEAVTQSEIIKFSAGGFRDFTRIAASDPTMWRDVFMANREAVLDVLGRFNEDLAALAKAIRWGDAEMLQDFFTRSRGIRRGIVQLGQATPYAPMPAPDKDS